LLLSACCDVLTDVEGLIPYLKGRVCTRQSPDLCFLVLAEGLPLTEWLLGILCGQQILCHERVPCQHHTGIAAARCLIGGMAGLLSWVSPPTGPSLKFDYNI